MATKQIRLKNRVLKVELCAGCPMVESCGLPKAFKDGFRVGCELEDWQDQPAVPKEAPEAATGGYLDKQKVLDAKDLDDSTGVVCAGAFKERVIAREFDATPESLAGLCNGRLLEINMLKNQLANKDATITHLLHELDDFRQATQEYEKHNGQLKDEIEILKGSENLLVYRGKELDNEIAALKEKGSNP